MGMDVCAFNTSLHFDTMINWLRERDSYLPTEQEMPKIGYVVYNNQFPVAMAFLRKVEGDFAQLDGLVTNPNASSHDRHEGIWAAVTEIIKACKALNIRHVLSFSTDSSIIERSASHGFSAKPVTVLIAEVK